MLDSACCRWILVSVLGLRVLSLAFRLVCVVCFGFVTMFGHCDVVFCETFVCLSLTSSFCR
jgi:hypothetical protein